MLITRYLVRNLLTVTVFVALTLTTVIWLTQSLKLLELVANSDAPPSLFLRLVVLSLPKFLEIILPLALAVSVIFTYNRLTADNELIVMRACGVDQMGLARPALLLAGAVTALLLVFSAWITPESTAKLARLRTAVKAEYSAFLLREGVFNTFGDDLTVYLRARGADGDLYGLMIHDTRDKDKPPVTVTAKKGRIVTDGETPVIVVFDGMRQQQGARGGAASRLRFARYTIEIQNLAVDAASRWHEEDERTLPRLFNPDLTDARDREMRDLFTAEINHRLVTPLNALGYTLIALAFLLSGPFNRRGQRGKILAACVGVALAQALNIAVVSLMKKNIAFVPALYAATLLPIAAGMAVLRGDRVLSTLLRRLRRRREAAP